MSEMLIDTDIFVDFLRNNNKAKNFFEKIISGQITGYSSVITEAELFSGKECEISEKKDAVNNLLSLINKTAIDSIIARQAGEFRRKYQIPLMDALIAASAF